LDALCVSPLDTHWQGEPMQGGATRTTHTHYCPFGLGLWHSTTHPAPHRITLCDHQAAGALLLACFRCSIQAKLWHSPLLQKSNHLPWLH